MAKGRGWIERLAETTDLQGEAFPGQPLVEIYGERRVLIEHHGGVTEYGRERIQVKMRYGYVCICGTCLELARMTAEQLIITGRIDSVNIIRRR
jgi:sporulation protein YqfC